MQLSGEYLFRAPLDAVWGALMDPSVLSQALPGGEQLEQVGENEYQAVMNVKVGPVQGRFTGRIELADIEPQRAYRMKVNGQGTPGFLNGEGRLELEPVQDESGADATLLKYGGEVSVGGKVANVGQRMIEATARSITRQGLEALERQIRATAAPEAPDAEAAQAAVIEEGAALAPPVEPEAAVPVPEAPALDAEAALPSGAADAPAWQPVSTRRTVSSAAQPAHAGAGGSVLLTTLRDVAGDLASDYLTPKQQERAVWAGVGALCMLLFVVLVRLVQKR